MFGLNKKELRVLKKLNNPKKIQDFLNELKVNYEKNGETCMSPRNVLKTHKAHCIEAAMLACVALRLHGFKPLVVDLTANRKDYDHVIAVFKQFGKWGAITKDNHAVLRYREPIYKDIRELVMSFFHEYTKRGIKTLRSYSMPVDLSKFDKLGWMTSKEDVWYIHDYLAKIKHKKILNKKQIANLRKQDLIEIRAGEIVEYTENGKKTFWTKNGTRKIKFNGGKMKEVSP